MFNIPSSTQEQLFGTISQLWADLGGLIILAIGVPVSFLIMRVIIRAVSGGKYGNDDSDMI